MGKGRVSSLIRLSCSAAPSCISLYTREILNMRLSAYRESWVMEAILAMISMIDV